MNLEAIIGLEIHLQLKSNSKLFSSAPTTYGNGTNTQIAPLDMAFPGAMPQAVNKQCVISAIKMADALRMSIAEVLRFDRKNYFYSDLPKGYQITQFYHPIGRNGVLTINTSNGEKTINIDHMHIEEDSAKQVHLGNKTLIDFNRAGMGLIEIVSCPDIRNGEEARAFLEKIREIAVSLNISTGRLQEGTMRVDTNVSLKNKDTGENGTIVELKNLNGFRNVQRAIDSEIKRQKERLNNGKKVYADTRRYDEHLNKTIFMRHKNKKYDYKYFEDSNIAPVRLSKEFIESAINETRNNKDEINLPFITKATVKEINSDPYLKHLFKLLEEKNLATLKVTNFVLTRVRNQLKRYGSGLLSDIEDDLVNLLMMFETDKLTYKQTSIVYQELIKNEKRLETLLNEYNFTNQVKENELSSIIDEILLQYIDAVNDYRNGKDKALNYLLGQVYKRTRNNVDIAKAKEILLNKLEEK